MITKITYPPVAPKKYQHRRFLRLAKWPFLTAAYLCPLINLVLGGRAWSLLVLASLYLVWFRILSPDLVEYNRISQFIKSLISVAGLISLVDLIYVPGLAILIVPIIAGVGLVVSTILFFTDFDRQRQNMLPLLLFDFASLAGAILAQALAPAPYIWLLKILAGLAMGALLACGARLGDDFWRELRRRFHLK